MKPIAMVTALTLLASVVSAHAMSPAPVQAFKNGSNVTEIKAMKKTHHMSGRKGHNMSGMQEQKGMKGMGGDDKMPEMSAGDHSKMKGMKGM